MKHTLFKLSFVLLSFTTSAQTVFNHDLNAGINSSLPSTFTVYNNRLYFMARTNGDGNELWSLDTGANPRLDQNVNPGTNDGVLGAGDLAGLHAMSKRKMAVVKDAEEKELALYFCGSDKPSIGIQPRTLYKYDLSSSPTPIALSLGSDELMKPYEIVAVGTKVYFLISSPVDGNYVYEYDHRTGAQGSVYKNNYTKATNLTSFNGKLLFSEKDGIYEFDPVSRQVTQITTFISAAEVAEIRVIGNKAYIQHDANFYEYTGTGKPVYLTNLLHYENTPTSQLAPEAAGQSFEVYKNRLYYSYNTGKNGKLAAYDFNTKKVNIVPGNAYNPNTFAIAKGVLYFAAYDSTHGYELWSYNGVSPAAMLVDIFPGVTDGLWHDIVSFKDKIYCVGLYGPVATLDLELLELRLGTGGTSLQSVSLNGDIIIYPNPTTNACNIAMDLSEVERLSLQVYSTLGQLVYDLPVAAYAAGKNSITIPMGSMTAGTYTVQLHNDSGHMLYSTQLVKQ
ncbi:MAG TPA: T9SS type A sorting domain-containing protein [Flavipsychrobacter sp.]